MYINGQAYVEYPDVIKDHNRVPVGLESNSQHNTI